MRQTSSVLQVSCCSGHMYSLRVYCPHCKTWTVALCPQVFTPTTVLNFEFCSVFFLFFVKYNTCAWISLQNISANTIETI